jgi:tetratricopeptide (TPR) repeat protein
MSELDKAIHFEITRLGAAGDQLAQKSEYKAAIAEYNRAWKLIPEPKNNWEASTWVLAAIADASFLGGFYNSAKEALRYAMTCPGAIGNPFLHLRLGQVLFETDEIDAAANELMRAYMGDGSKVFEGQDPKYLSFLRTRAKI